MKKNIFSMLALFAVFCLIVVGMRYLLFGRKTMGVGDDEYKRAETSVLLNWLSSGVRVYVKFNGKFPSVDGSLQQNLEAGGVSFSVNDEFPFTAVDGWGNDIQYRVSNSTSMVVSAGKDFVFGTGDDMLRTIIIDNGTNTTWDYKSECIWKRSCMNRNRVRD